MQELMYKGRHTLSDVENMIPWERDIYTSFFIEEEKRKQKLNS